MNFIHFSLLSSNKRRPPVQCISPGAPNINHSENNYTFEGDLRRTGSAGSHFQVCETSTAVCIFTYSSTIRGRQRLGSLIVEPGGETKTFKSVVGRSVRTAQQQQQQKKQDINLSPRAGAAARRHPRLSAGGTSASSESSPLSADGTCEEH